VVIEVGSGMNAHRRKLSRLFTDGALTTIIIEHRDRLAHLGVEHLKSALSPQGPRILADDAEVDDDLVGDMTEVLTSFCTRLYGHRGARNRAEKALRCAKHDVGPMALSHPGASV
jgi:putative resolvase